MTAVTIDQIKELRNRTGVGMNKCKAALVEAAGDMEAAIANLRKAGMASAVKKGGREAKEGIVVFADTGDAIALVEINAETDFVVKNEAFQEFAKNIAEEVASKRPESVEAFLNSSYSKDSNLTIDELRAMIVQKIGENIVIKRLSVMNKPSDASLGVYSHMGGKIVTVVELAGATDEAGFARDIAMHIAACRPDYLNSEAVPQDVVEKEREIARAQVQGKPENIVDKIIDGKIKAFFKSACLYNQPYVRDEDHTVEQLVQKHGKEGSKELNVRSFQMWEVGQG